MKLSRKPIRVVNSCLAQPGLAFTLPAEPIGKVYGPITEYVQHVCDDTLDFIQVPGYPTAIHLFALTHSRRKVIQRLPWLISFPLGNTR